MVGSTGRKCSEQQEKFNFSIPLSYTGDWGQTWSYEASPFPAIGSVQCAVLLPLHARAAALMLLHRRTTLPAQAQGPPLHSRQRNRIHRLWLYSPPSPSDEGRSWPVQKLITPGGSWVAALRVVRSAIRDFEQLHLPPIVRQLSESQRGIILMAGAPGSGKSTTLAAMLQHLNRKFRQHIITRSRIRSSTSSRMSSA
jgi:hypothetical protein